MKFVQKKIRIMFRKIGKKYAMSSIGSLIWLNENKASEIGVGFVERVIKFYWFIKELWFLMKPMVFITFPNSKRLDQKLIYHEIDFLHAIYDYEIIFISSSVELWKLLVEHKAELLQLNHTQFPSLGIFVSKKVGNQKN